MTARRFEALGVSMVLLVGMLFLSGCGVIPSPVHLGGTTVGGTTTGGLPTYPGSHESSEQSMWAILTGFSHQFSEVHEYVVEGASPEKVLAWYTSQFPEYTANEETVTLQGKTVVSLTLKKGNTLLGVIAFANEKETIYFVGKVTQAAQEGDALPNHDMASGEEPLERYPGSVMLSYSKDGTFPIHYDIEYGTNDAYEKVGDWFKSALSSQGWSVISQSGSADTIELELEKNDDDVTIYLGAPGAGTAYTTIDVSYTKRTVPDHDLVNGTDPLERYPGAVLIDYSTSTMSVQGVRGSEITAEYLTSDTFEAVKKWYLGKLNAMFGSGGALSGVYDQGESIDAGGEYDNKLVQVHIDFERGENYTEVSVDYTMTETG